MAKKHPSREDEQKKRDEAAGLVMQNTPADQAHPDVEPLTADEVNAFAGDEVPAGGLGWLTLDEEGRPTGTATLRPPEPGTPAARVFVNPPIQALDVHTPAGAPITAQMNPSPDRLMDEGFYERNPPDGVPQPPSTPDRGGYSQDQEQQAS